MAMLYIGADWQQTFDPMVSRTYEAEYLWPYGVGSDSGGGDKALLEQGDHPFLAIGVKAIRPLNEVGVLMTFDGISKVLNLAHGFAAKAAVANVLTYAAGSPDTFDTSVNIGDPVYIDDSDDLATNVTLSLSPLNDLGADNPLAGFVFYDQTEYDDAQFGGEGSARSYPVTVADELTVVTLTVMLE